MADFVVDSTGDDSAHGVDLVDGDAPAIRLIVRGDLPASMEHDGRTWVWTQSTDDAGDAPAIRVYRPAS